MGISQQGPDGILTELERKAKEKETGGEVR